MKISVLIPAYNSEATIQATLESVLRQTTPPEEILVINDGSTDQTASILKDYESRVTVLDQPNAGISGARNALIARAKGDVFAFLDSDDIWHPRYLEEQKKLIDQYPNGAAFFRAHENFCGLGSYEWGSSEDDKRDSVEVISPTDFIERCCLAPGPFIMSFCCIPRRVLEAIGSEPFKLRVAEDVYFDGLLPLFGPVVYASRTLGAYRIREGSLASNRLKLTEGEVRSFELLEDHYRISQDPVLSRAFTRAFGVKRRLYAKVLLGAGMTPEARKQLKRSLNENSNLPSVAKSLTLLLLSYLPDRLQPLWPSSSREWKGSENT